MIKSGSTERHPLMSLLLLILLMMGGALVFGILAVVVVIATFGMKAILSMGNSGGASIEMLRVLQIFTSAGMFIAPALLFARLEDKDWLSFLKLRKFTTVLVVLAILIMIASSPLLEWSSALNKSMKLPGFLSELERWMFLKEQEMARMTKQLLRMESVSILLVNILMLAIIPAIGEEFIFRGCLQKILARWSGNQHLAIWAAAIIFSAIHVQFYGFIPRMLLGALFGYLLVWSGSMWVAVLGHFINNALAVITAYTYQQKGISLEKLDQPDPSPYYIYIISFFTCSILLWVFYTISRKYGLSITKGADGSRLG